MKKIVSVLLLLLPLSLMAQQTNNFDTFFNKYAGKDNYTTVDITPDFLKLILGFAGQEDEELKKLVSNIDRIRIITCQENNPNFAKDVNNLISINKLYKPITNINNGGESTTIYVVKKDDIVTDFLLTAFNKTEQVVINITGKNLDINKVSNLSKNVQIKGMEKL